MRLTTNEVVGGAMKETYGMTYEEESEYLREIKVPELQAVVDAAIVYVHATEMAHHGPYSQQQGRHTAT